MYHIRIWYIRLHTLVDSCIGHILSDWMSIRDYCMTQLRTIWFHMRTNMSFGDEERSFFIMSSMYELFMVSILNDSVCIVFTSSSFNSYFKKRVSLILMENLLS